MDVKEERTGREYKKGQTHSGTAAANSWTSRAPDGIGTLTSSSSDFLHSDFALVMGLFSDNHEKTRNENAEIFQDHEINAKEKRGEAK